MRRLTLLLGFLLLFGCNTKKESPYLQEKGTIEFNNPLRSNYRFMGKTKDSLNNDLIYFADIATAKRIYFHNTSGTLVDSIIYEKGYEGSAIAQSLNFISKDTFMVAIKGHLLFYNKSKLIKDININTLLEKEDSFYNFDFSGRLNMSKTKNSFIAGLDWRADKEKGYENYSEESFKHPNMMIINNVFTDSITYQMIDKNYYQVLFDKPAKYLEPFKSYYLNNRNFLATNFKNEIIYFDSDLSFKTFNIDSDYTTVRKKPTYEEATNVKGAYVDNIFYNNNVYSLVLSHEIYEDDPDLLRCPPFSIIRYNENFEKIEEKMMKNDTEYRPYYSLNIGDKIYIRKDPKNYNENIFAIF